MISLFFLNWNKHLQFQLNSQWSLSVSKVAIFASKSAIKHELRHSISHVTLPQLYSFLVTLLWSRLRFTDQKVPPITKRGERELEKDERDGGQHETHNALMHFNNRSEVDFVRNIPIV